MEKSTLRTLIRRAYTACSNGNLLQEELHHIETCFTKINGHSKWLLKQTFNSFKISNNKNYNSNISNKNNNNKNINNSSDKTVHTLKLAYKGDNGINLIKLIKTPTKKTLPEKYGVRIVSTGTKLSSQFSINDVTNKQNKRDLVYFSMCPSTTCADSYIGETARC